MKPFRRFAARFCGVFRASAIDREITEELESHLQLHIDDNVQRGMSEEDARAEALRCLGDIRQTKFLYRRQAILPTLFRRLQEFLYSLTSLKRSALFTATLFLSLTLTVGFATAVIGLLYNTVLSPYPYHDARGMRHLLVRDQAGNLIWPLYSEAQFQQVANSPAVESAMAYRNREYRYEFGGGAHQAMGTELSGRAFAYLGVPSRLGRGIGPDDITPHRPSAPVVVLGYRLWSEAFASDPNIVGKLLTMSGRPYRIVGVAAPRFTWGDGELFVPLGQEDDPSPDLEINLRLRSGVGRTEADRILGGLLDSFDSSGPNQFPQAFTLAVTPLNTPFSRHNRPVFETLCEIAACLSCFTILNVCLLAAYRVRLREAKPSSPSGVAVTEESPLSYVLTECGLLAGTSCIAGLVIAALLTPLFYSFLPRYAVPSEAPAQLGIAGLWIVLCFGLFCWSLLAFASGGLYLSALSLERTIRTHAVSLRRTLAGLQAVAGVLLVYLIVGAIHRYMEASTRPLGYSSDGVYVVSLPPNEVRYPGWKRRASYYQTILHSLRQQFHQATFAVTSYATPPNGGLNTTIWPDRARNLTGLNASSHLVSADFFDALEVPFVEGGAWTDSADNGGEAVVVINETLRQKIFGAAPAVGRTIGIALPSYLQYSVSPPSIDRPFRVVGVVADFQNDSLEKAVAPSVYVPFTMLLDRHTVLLVRLPDRSSLSEIEKQLTVLDPSLAAVPHMQALAMIRKSILTHGPIKLLALSSGVVIVCFSLVGALAFVTRHWLANDERSECVDLRMTDKTVRSI